MQRPILSPFSEKARYPVHYPGIGVIRISILIFLIVILLWALYIFLHLDISHIIVELEADAYSKAKIKPTENQILKEWDG